MKTFFYRYPWVTPLLWAVAIALVMFTPTIGGMLGRGAVVVWFMWAGVIDQETAEHIALNWHF